MRALKARQPMAAAQFYDRYAVQVQRVLARVMGADQDLADLLQEVFARALAEIDKLERGDRLGAWLNSVAVFTARGHIRRRKRQRWLRFFAPEELPERVVPEPEHDVQRAVRAMYSVMDQLPTDERIVFALRFMEEMELLEVAEACGVSLATVKRRLARAERRFIELAQDSPALRARLQGDIL
ncbi:MAG: sigma-70 family RNA polymerase sigma factor [Myxococcales bacterium]